MHRIGTAVRGAAMRLAWIWTALLLAGNQSVPVCY